MAELNFQTSRKTYTVNGGAEISFDPADVGFAERLHTLMGKLEKLNDRERPAEEDAFRAAKEEDRRIRGEIDAAFGEPVCEKVFGRTNVLSPAGGAPLYMNFLLAVIDEVDAAAARETKTSPRLEKYLRKYEKKYGKSLK